MAGSTSDDYGMGRSPSVEGITSGQRCQSADSLAEWRSSEQVENGTPSTSPPYWDTDDDDDDCGAKPSELYGKFTWKIENFSQINKRELRSNAFEVGGYKWYILIYPQGCDVCNHLSLFLCVANHEKLLPGWSHFAQFTIAVVNKDPKKSKYSDTLHRFWKKEHDWGWKKFMELSKVSDGFIVSDNLVIKAQVQVIREKANRPFRCLDCQYRRELVRVYLSNVEQICRRFVEERRGKLSKLIEDKVRWTSFRAFWLGVDGNARRCMSRDNAEPILKAVVKHFFIEKEVTSTLVMDSLYSGLKALECQSKNKKGRTKLIEMEEMPVPFVRVDQDMFILTDDVLSLLERAAFEPLPPKDDKAAQNQNQNRTKDGSSGEEFNKDSIERDERRLTELGRRTVEIFVLTHIFSGRIEVAYQEAVALKRQEELIREEEEAGQAENELKSKRAAAEKEKRTKKKQAKQRRSGRKGKERGQDEKSDVIMQEKHQQESPLREAILDEFSTNQALSILEKVGTMGDISDVSENGDDVTETLQPDLEGRDASLTSWDTDTSEFHPATEAGSTEIQIDLAEKKSLSVLDDSSSTCSSDSIPSVVSNAQYRGNSSTCSSDSIPSVVSNAQYRGNSLVNNKSLSSPSRGKSQRGRMTRDRISQAHNDKHKLQHGSTNNARHLRDTSASCRVTEAVLSLKDRIQRLEQHLVEKEGEVVSLQKKLSDKDQVDVDRPSKSREAEQSSTPSNPVSVSQQPKQMSENSTPAMELFPIRESSSNSLSDIEKLVPLVMISPQVPPISKPEVQKSTIPVKVTTTNQVSAMSRPLSAPLTPGLRPTINLVSTVQTMPSLSRSVSAAGRLGADPSPSTPSHTQSYRNAMMGKASADASPATSAPRSSLSSTSQALRHSQSPPSFVSSLPATSLQTSSSIDQNSVRPGFTFGSVNPETLQARGQWTQESLQIDGSGSALYNDSFVNDVLRLDVCGSPQNTYYSGEATSSVSARQTNIAIQDEFPHLDIINDLLDEEQGTGKLAVNGHHHHQHPFNRQHSFQVDMSVSAGLGPSSSSCSFDFPDCYYDDEMHRVCSPSNGLFDRRKDLGRSQSDLSPYMHGPMDGLIQNQWPLGAVDHSILGLGSVDTSGYPYQLPDYSNLACGLKGYTLYRPANGF